MTEKTVAGATQGQLIEMLYARAIRDLETAKDLLGLGLQASDASKAAASELIDHARQILCELNRSINMKDGGALAINLATLYEYMQKRLTEAIASADPKPATEVAGLLEELRQAWESLNSQNRGS